MSDAAAQPTEAQLHEMAKTKALLETYRSQLEALRVVDEGSLLVYPIQDNLRAIDSQRVDGKFMFGGKIVPPGQAQVVDLLEQCYGLVYQVQNGIRAMTNSLERVKEDLQYLNSGVKKPNFVQLAPLQDHLLDVSQRLGQGRFQNEKGNIPPGQAKLFDLLNECYDIKNAIVDKIEAKQPQ